MAGIDTLDGEPVQADHWLFQQDPEILERIIISPHIGGITGQSFRRSFAMILEDMKSIENNEIPERTVNRKVLQGKAG